MNSWEWAEAEKAKLLAEKAAKDVAHVAEAVAQKEAPVAEGLASKALHAVEAALGIGSAHAAPQEPTPPAAPTPPAPSSADERKAALLAELHKLEDQVAHLGG